MVPRASAWQRDPFAPKCDGIGPRQTVKSICKTQCHCLHPGGWRGATYRAKKESGDPKLCPALGVHEMRVGRGRRQPPTDLLVPSIEAGGNTADLYPAFSYQSDSCYLPGRGKAESWALLVLRLHQNWPGAGTLRALQVWCKPIHQPAREHLLQLSLKAWQSHLRTREAPSTPKTCPFYQSLCDMPSFTTCFTSILLSQLFPLFRRSRKSFLCGCEPFTWGPQIQIQRRTPVV